VALEVFKDNRIIGLSSKQQIIVLSSSSRQDSLRVLHQYKLIETANTLLRNPTSGCEILLTRDGIFIGNQKFQYLKRSLTPKDQEYDFESYRRKELK